MLRTTNRFGVCRADLTVCLALLLLGSTFVVAAAQQMNELDARKKCAANLRMIGQGLLLYANENRGAYPRTVADLTTTDKPVWGTPYEADKKLGPAATTDPFAKDGLPEAATRPQPNDVSAAVFLLIRTQEMTPDMFVCPSTRQRPWDFGGGKNTALNWTNWKGAEVLRNSLSYSYQNPYPSQAAIGQGFRLNTTIGAEFAIASDLNSGLKDLLTALPTDDKKKMSKVNSPNHGGAGQNVLFGDGHVELTSSPFVGVERENVFTYGASGGRKPGSGGDGIVGSPVDANDSILLPTAADLGIPLAQPASAPAR